MQYALKIGELAKSAECKVETIRFYEKIGLIPEPARTESGYREYKDEHLRRLVFIRRSRELGFTIEEIRVLLELVDGGSYTCGDIQALTVEHLENIRQKIVDLEKLEKSLAKIASQCSGEKVPQCPVIDALFE